jgi:hypothetical protein
MTTPTPTDLWIPPAFKERQEKAQNQSSSGDPSDQKQNSPGDPTAQQQDKVKGPERRASAEPNLRDKLGGLGGQWSEKHPAAGPVRGLLRAQVDAGQYWGSKASNLASRTPGLPPALSNFAANNKWAARFIPGVGTVIGLGVLQHELKEKDYVGASLAALSVIPGPVGWLGLALSGAYGILGPERRLWGFLGPENGGIGEMTSPPGMNENGTITTYMLPIAAAGVASLEATDKAITDAQKAVFGFKDGEAGTVWRVGSEPKPLEIDNQSALLVSWLKDVSDVFSQINTELSNSGEQYMLQAQQKLKTHFDAMSNLGDYVALINNEIAAATKAASDWYGVVKNQNNIARSELSNTGELSSESIINALNTAQTTYRDKLDAANSALEALTVKDLETITPSASLGAARSGPTPKTDIETKPWVPTTIPQGPPLTPAGGPPTTPPPKDDISDILSKLGNNLGGGAPLGGGMPGLGGMPLGGLGGQPLGGGTPLNTPAPKPLAPEAKPVLGTERKDLVGASPENKVVPVADKKLDEKKDGLVAGPPAAAAAAPEKPGEPKVKSASAKPEKPDTTVDVKGKKIEFPDTKTAALAAELAKATPGSPASLADAATKAGLVPPVPGQDPGQQVSPQDAKPGDLFVAGDKSYMLLSDGEFLDHTNGKVVDADQMPKDLGSKGGYFSLQDAAGGEPSGPVSGQAPTTTTMSVDQTSQVPAGAGAAAAPTPEETTATAAPAGGAPTASPGVPTKGEPGSGPTNAESTDTGRGTGMLASGPKPLDPTAIK